MHNSNQNDTKRINTKRRNTKRRNTKQRNTKRRNTKQRNTKRRGGKVHYIESENRFMEDNNYLRSLMVLLYKIRHYPIHQQNNSVIKFYKDLDNRFWKDMKEVGKDRIRISSLSAALDSKEKRTKHFENKQKLYLLDFGTTVFYIQKYQLGKDKDERLAILKQIQTYFENDDRLRRKELTMTSTGALKQKSDANLKTDLNNININDKYEIYKKMYEKRYGNEQQLY